MGEKTVKPRAQPAVGTQSRPAPKSAYLRDTRSGIINTRPAILRESRDDIRLAWRRAAGLAMDLFQNSGRLKGVADQVIGDTVGVELVYNPQPNLQRLGWSAKEEADWIKLLKEEWKLYSWSPAECDLRGKFTVGQMVDIALRWDMAFGEATGVLSYMNAFQRKRYRLETGTKMCMIAPTALVQDTNEFEGLYQGITHDENGRPVAYRFEERRDGMTDKYDYQVRDRDGRAVVVHVFDPQDASDVRGISRIAPAFRKHIQHEILVDATIQTAVLQTVFAAALTSPMPSTEAFEAIEALGEGQSDKTLRDDFRDYFMGTLDRAAEGGINISGDPRVSHLAPGEKLELLSTQTPGPQFLPVSKELSRDMARAIGTSSAALTMDYEGATYSSTRMETSAIHPGTVRRRERIAAPIPQAIVERFIDEKIGNGSLPFKDGYDAFAANRSRVCWALWQGPAKPTADDLKSAKASTERLQNGTSTLAVECAEIGLDPDEVFEQRKREHDRYVSAGMPSPFLRNGGGGNDLEADEVKEKRT